MNIKKKLCLLVLVMMLSGCATFEKLLSEEPSNYEQHMREMYIDSHPELSDEIKNKILNGKIAIGMTRTEVELILGKPNHINRSDNEEGSREVWTYPVENYVLIFYDDILKDWQRFDKRY